MLKSVSDNKNSMHETKMRINCEDKSNKVCNKEEEGEIFTAESKLQILRDEDKIEQLDGFMDINPDDFDRIKNNDVYISSEDEEMPSLEEGVVDDPSTKPVTLMTTDCYCGFQVD